MNKNIIVLLVAIALIVAGYLFFVKNNTPETTGSSDYVGLTSAEAEAKASEEGMLFRVVEQDGEQLPTTKDFREGRINAVVTAGVVTSYTVETKSGTAEKNHDAIIGMTVAEAEIYASTNNIPFRVGTVDGEGLPVTLDFRMGRITAELENDLIVGYTVE